MKKLTIYSFALLMGAVMFSACKKDKIYEPENFVVVQENQVPNGTLNYTLSVQVVPSSEKGRVSGLDQATVTINSAGGTATVTTAKDGIAVFSGLSEGFVSIYVEATGYSKMNTSVFLDRDPDLVTGSDAAVTQFVRVPVTLPRLGATLKARIYGNFPFDTSFNKCNYDNAVITRSSHYISGVTIRIDYNDPNMQPNFYTTTTDASGFITFSNVPEDFATLSVEYTATRTDICGALNYDVVETFIFSGGTPGANLIADRTIDLGSLPLQY
ncbi:MAG: hypothetical protein FVQ77_09895 [Cytophagales bacterium]|nr:hypothetical protein [Cytophagales bacterium]